MPEIIELVPSSDAAPALPSRIVTVNLAGPTEGALTSGERTVSFRLVGDIHSAKDRIIVGSGYSVTAKSGDRVRLPCFDGKTGEWAIEVRKSWAPHPYAIRIPAGSTTVDLSALKPVITLPSMMSQHAVTGAGITVKQGAQWDASVTLNGGVLGFELTVPPAGTAWFRGAIGSAHLDTVTEPGQYVQAYSSGATTANGYPVATSGQLLVTNAGPTVTQQYVTVAYGIWIRQQYNGNWGDWVRQTSTIHNRGLLGTADLDTVTAEGTHYQLYQGNATSARHYPAPYAGQLEVRILHAASGIYSQVYWCNDATSQGVWRRIRSGGTWGEWSRINSTIRNRGLLGSRDLDTVLEDGTYYQAYTSWPDMVGEQHYPEKSQGQLEVRILDAASGTRSQEYAATSSGTTWRRVSAGSVWGEWRPIGGAGVAGEDAPGAPGLSSIRRQARVLTARKRLLGGAGTSGLGAVALRFDDGHDAFKAKVLPLLRKYQLPSYHAVSERYLNESAITDAELQSWALNDAVEMNAHSRTHANSTGAAILDNLYTWGDALQSRVGQIVVDSWTFPGGGDFDGLNAGAQTALFADTYAGRLLMERYAVPYGGTAGWLQPLTGEPTVGQVHVTIEAMTAATQVTDFIRMAQDGAMGISLMLHPTRLDADGYMSSAVLDQILGWIAAERAAGRLVVLTGTGMGFADSGSFSRVSLVPRLSGWTGSGWTISGDTASTSGTTALTAATQINGYAGSRGAPVEFSVTVEGNVGAKVTLGLSAGVMSTTHTATLTATSERVHLVATLPTGISLGSDITASITRVSSTGALTVRNPQLATI